MKCIGEAQLLVFFHLFSSSWQIVESPGGKQSVELLVKETSSGVNQSSATGCWH